MSVIFALVVISAIAWINAARSTYRKIRERWWESGYLMDWLHLRRWPVGKVVERMRTARVKLTWYVIGMHGPELRERKATALEVLDLWADAMRTTLNTQEARDVLAQRMHKVREMLLMDEAMAIPEGRMTEIVQGIWRDRGDSNGDRVLN